MYIAQKLNKLNIVKMNIKNYLTKDIKIDKTII